jgi:hypothetical protein
MRAGAVLSDALVPDMSIDCIGYSPLTLHKLRGRVLNGLLAFSRAVQTSYCCSFFRLSERKNEQQKKSYLAAAGGKSATNKS